MLNRESKRETVSGTDNTSEIMAGDRDAECEDAIFKACDARERYPIQCANELGKCIEIYNEISMEAVVLKPTLPLVITQMADVQKIIIQNFEAELKHNSYASTENENGEFHKMLEKINNLKAVVQQLENYKLCELNRLI